MSPARWWSACTRRGASCSSRVLLIGLDLRSAVSSSQRCFATPLCSDASGKATSADGKARRVCPRLPRPGVTAIEVWAIGLAMSRKGELSYFVVPER
jgi:hypothetical protein